MLDVSPHARFQHPVKRCQASRPRAAGSSGKEATEQSGNLSAAMLLSSLGLGRPARPMLNSMQHKWEEKLPLSFSFPVRMNHGVHNGVPIFPALGHDHTWVPKDLLIPVFLPQEASQQYGVH